jgi:hypothetical protein
MQTFACLCGNILFYENTACLACGREVGWCPLCQQLVALLPEACGGYRCGQPVCGTPLQKCHNYVVEQVCNRCLAVGAESQPPEALCDCCRYNETIPDLSVPGNREKWYRLEVAKRRLFYTLNLLGLPYGRASDGFSPPLAFDFKADVLPATHLWRAMGPAERVYTGHAHGKITLNIREADDVVREKLRVDFGEAHRTLIGHFRHEIGHYYWDLLVSGRCEVDFQCAFGDYQNPPYATALEQYYQSGPPPDWQQQYVSAYASMHPWEDFAETFATYLAMVCVLDTARHMGVDGVLVLPAADLDQMVVHYQRLGVVINEMNRAMGLIDLVPQVFVSPVIEKLRYLHTLVRTTGQISVKDSNRP